MCTYLWPDKGPFKYYVITFLTFLGPPTHLFDDVILECPHTKIECQNFFNNFLRNHFPYIFLNIFLDIFFNIFGNFYTFNNNLFKVKKIYARCTILLHLVLITLLVVCIRSHQWKFKLFNNFLNNFPNFFILSLP